jgi:Rod binding domain-containing protein
MSLNLNNIRLPAADPLAGLQQGKRATQRDRLTKETEQWVSQTFFATMLKQMRESPFRSDLFSGGRAGQAYGALYDQHLAAQMGRGAGSKLVQAIVNRLEGTRAYRNVRTDVPAALRTRDTAPAIGR